MFSRIDEAEGTVGNLVLDPVSHVAAETSLAACARRLIDCGVGALIVASAPLRVVTRREIVRAVASGVPSDAAVGRLDSVAPVVVFSSTSVEAAMKHLVDAPSSCLLVEDASAHLLGRLTLLNVLRAVRSRPAWVRALQLALHLENTTALKVGL